MRIPTLLLIAAALAAPALATAAEVKIAKQGDGFQLTVDGKPFTIHGAGGDASKALLAQVGGNTCRTWGADDIQDRLDDAHKHGLKVIVGIWLGHERHGFNWSDAGAVAKQFAMAKGQVQKWKDHPALLAWGLGNEMEGFDAGDNEAIWKGIEDLARMTRELDPHHPTMTTTSEIGGKRLEMLNRFCPSIDIIGINSYGGAPSLPKRYREGGGTRPYAVTEYGIPGTWEIGKNAFGAVDELTSTAKGPIYRKVFETLAKDPLCVGSLAFSWGSKVEATATWYGMILPDGSRLAAVDELSAAWGKPVPNRCPTIEPITVPTEALKPGAKITVTTVAADPENDPLRVEWVLSFDPQNYNTGGDAQAAPPTYPEAIGAHDLRSCELTMPESGGLYRIYAYVHDGKGGAALHNAVLKVDGPVLPPKPPKATLPTTLLGDGAVDTWAASGWMGDTKAIAMANDWSENPRSGKTCLQVAFEKDHGWGGVIWQSPANDWGSQPGGMNLTGATKLSFWARGKAGGEKVKIGFGAIGKDKPFHDSAKGEKEFVLTDAWAQYSLDVAGKDLSRIKSGFQWVVAGQGKPVVFYLDDVRWE